jgi:CheY-like chemotaxis protein
MKQSAPAAASAGPTILVVEDNGMVRNLVARALRELGHRVLEAEDGLAALDVLAGGEKINLVITDLVMPRMDGYQLAAQLESRAHRPAVLFISGCGVTHQELTPLLQKPFAPGVLQCEVQRMLDICGG